ncbi:MAG: tetratricopeptide repeat protein [Bdellovibrionota bacterium]
MEKVTSFFLALALLVLGAALPLRAETKEKLPPPAASERPADKAQAKIAEAKRCYNETTQRFDPLCTIPIYHEASKILRGAGIPVEETPHLYWTIFEGLGLAFLERGDFEEARKMFQTAGAIQKVPDKAREESAYNLGITQYQLGEKDQAIHTFEVLFQRNSDWLTRGEGDPNLSRLRETKEWKELATRLKATKP